MMVALTMMVGACHHTSVNQQKDYPTWVSNDTSNFESSMTITGIIPSTLQNAADTADLVAAFSGDECWGVTKVQMIDGTPYFFLYINRPLLAYYTDETTALTLRYYCTKTKYQYVQKDAVSFEVDGHIGTVENPFIPEFSQE